MNIRKLASLSIVLVLSGVLLAGEKIGFDALTCDFRENPIGVDNNQPVFGWILHSSSDNVCQKSYEIIVSDRLDDIEHYKGENWSSGIVHSSNNIHVKYEGEPLKSFMRYYWRVRIFDMYGNSSGWSDVASFQMAMLNERDWEAQWISDGSNVPEKMEDFYKDDPAPLFGREFTIEKKVESAMLYISGLGYYEAYLNGRKISDYFLDTGWTAYDKQVLYNVHDISNLIENGNNKFGAIVGNGWHNLVPLKFWGRHIFRNGLASGQPILKAQLRIRYADGSTETISTDENWKVTQSPVLRNSIFLGEYYDASREDGSWYGLKNKTSEWNPVYIASGSMGSMSVQTSPPIRIYKEITPKSVIRQPDGKYLFDMGENFAGIVRIKLKEGIKGQKISLRYGEDICSDGTINVLTSVAGQIKGLGVGGPGAPDIAWQEDIYISSGEGEIEEWSPRFTFHSFRYVEVSGWPGIPDAESLIGLALAADLDRHGSFSSSNTMFNCLYEVIDRTFLSNVFSVQSDCPAREKLGYGGDIVATAGSYLYNYNMHTFYRKSVRDFANDQRENGGITETAPYVGISDKGPDVESGPLGWQLAYPYLIKQLYEFYGDTSLINDHFESLERQVRFLCSSAQDDLYSIGLSDHESLDEKPVALTSSLFYYHHVKLFAEFAGILGKKEIQDEYIAKQEEIKQKVIQKFIREDGQADNGTQTAQIFALWYQLTDDDDDLKRRLVGKLEEALIKQEWHISTGIFGTKMLFDVLRDIEKEDWAYKVADQRTFPGWGYMLDRGATTLWETWAYSDDVYSHNHPMFGSVNEWFYQSILGINPLSPGFKTIKIKPGFPHGLTWASGHYQSAYGVIGSKWSIQNGNLNLDVEIPVNTMAEIWLPLKYGKVIHENGSKINRSKRILDFRTETTHIVVSVGSGIYHFQVSD
ncbi:family 78 glycoside hydrolase catalytic domain [Proteiniphilum sp.]|uniref:family 78 glycoside hydrolase catalytic domain n=1 Tax=Proteiniphilum sp. TaxID=1926877 RepID=UPI00331CA25B